MQIFARKSEPRKRSLLCWTCSAVQTLERCTTKIERQLAAGQWPAYWLTNQSLNTQQSCSKDVFWSLQMSIKSSLNWIFLDILFVRWTQVTKIQKYLFKKTLSLFKDTWIRTSEQLKSEPNLLDQDNLTTHTFYSSVARISKQAINNKGDFQISYVILIFNWSKVR